MSLFFTPEDLINVYHHLDVRLDDGPVEVKIDHYKNNRADMPAPYNTGPSKTEVLHPLKAKIRAAAKKDPDAGLLDSEPIDMAALNLTFAGKGMPDDIRQTLRLAVRHKLTEPDKLRLQRFCDKYIGLDCNGFVGNYLLWRGQERFGTNRSADGKEVDWIAIQEINRKAFRRHSADDIRANDVLIWGAFHIAIINQVFRTGSAVSFDVAESTTVGYTASGDKSRKGGIYMSRYQLLPPFEVKPGQPMRIRRAIGDTWSVYIVNVELGWPWDVARPFQAPTPTVANTLRRAAARVGASL
jgi:hypothetical protein